MSRQAPPGGQGSGGLYHVPWRDLADPAQLGRKTYPTLSYFSEAGKGGHFAAWEGPELFAAEIRAAFKPLR